MDFFYKWLLMASIQAAATISPGPAFAMTVRQALAYDRRIGIFTAIGLSLGVSVHILFAVLGISVVISQSVLLFNIIKYAGAAYLVYIGIKGLLARKKEAPETQGTDAVPVKNGMTPFKALQTGMLTNVLNPKAVAFFTAFYAQFATADTPVEIMALYGLTSIVMEVTWFSLVSIFLTTPAIKKTFVSFTHWVERVCGGLLVALGVRLAL